MSLNAAALKLMAEKGLSAHDIVEIAEAIEAAKPRSTGAERQARYRASKKQRNATGDVTRNVTSDRNTPPRGSPKENKQTPSSPPAQVSEPDGSSPEPRPWSLPVGVSLQIWTDLLSNRKRKRLGNTETAWKAFNDDLKRVASQTGIPPPKLIEMCTAKGWGAIYDPREEQHGRRTDSMGRHKPADGLSSTGRAAVAVFGAPDARQH